MPISATLAPPVDEESPIQFDNSVQDYNDSDQEFNSSDQEPLNSKEGSPDTFPAIAKNAESAGTDCVPGWLTPGGITCLFFLLLPGGFFLLNFVAPAFLCGSAVMKKSSAVKGNMRTLQIATESYATAVGHYPKSVRELAPFLPGGTNTLNGEAGAAPPNPFTGISDGAFVDSARITSSRDIRVIRELFVGKTGLSNGQICYSVVDGGSSYAITGTGNEGIAVSGIGGKTLILSNQ